MEFMLYKRPADWSMRMHTVLCIATSSRAICSSASTAWSDSRHGAGGAMKTVRSIANLHSRGR